MRIFKGESDYQRERRERARIAGCLVYKEQIKMIRKLSLKECPDVCALLDKNRIELRIVSALENRNIKQSIESMALKILNKKAMWMYDDVEDLRKDQNETKDVSVINKSMTNPETP